MTTANIKILHDAIGDAGKAAGFVKKGSSWYANRAESVLVINPQKSHYGEQYYLNLGVFFRLLGVSEKPKEQECHVRARLTDVVKKDEQTSVQQLLDFDAVLTSGIERKQALADFLLIRGVSFLEQCSSVEGVGTALSQGLLNAMPVSRSLRELLQPV
jgi:hypothetical protein